MQHNNFLLDSLKFYFSISLGIFLFILFFEPFAIKFDLNNQLIFIAGISAISFIIMVIIYLALPTIFPKSFNYKEWRYNPDILKYSVILILNTTAYVFYIRYVGGIQMTFFLVFKIALISVSLLVILKINKEYKILLRRIESLSEELKKVSKDITETSIHKNIKETFISDNKSDELDVNLDNIILINSADNYVKIVFIENETINNKLIRTTLKNIEDQLKKYTDFIRCHRTCIVNITHVDNLNRSYKGYRLVIKQYKEEIPVSLQHIQQVRERLNKV